MIEIGCVTPYYIDTNHKIYDIQDSHNKCICDNASNVDLDNAYLLSISTVEHFDVGDYNIKEADFLDPYEWIIEAIRQTNKYLITLPIGFNKKLDDKILNYNINISFLSRKNGSQYKEWTQKNKNQLTEADLLYDKSFTRCANTLAILDNFL